MKKFFLSLLLLSVFPAFAVEWDMGKVSIVMPKKEHPDHQLIKDELEFHLKYVSGTREPGDEFKMFIGTIPKGAPKAKKGDTFCVIEKNNIYFYGFRAARQCHQR